MAVVIQMQRVLQIIEAKHMEALKDIGVTSRQIAVMQAVAAAKSPSQTDITLATSIDRSTMADIVRRLVKKGFLKRSRTKADARAYEIHLTEDGSAAMKSALKAMKTVENKSGIPNFSGLAAAVNACLPPVSTAVSAAE